MNLEVPRAAIYDGTFPTYDVPLEMGHFSVNSDGKYCNDSHQLKYLALPNQMKGLHIDLNAGFSKYIYIKDDSENDYNTILRWIVTHQDKIKENFMDDFTSRVTIDFVCFRGALKRVCATIYEKFGEWHILAKKYKSTIYLADITEDKECGSNKGKRRESTVMKLPETERRMWTWGFKFEQYMTSDTMHSRPSTSDPVNENEKCYNVMKGKYGKYNLLFGGEVDCVDPALFLDADGHASTSVRRYVELKTSRLIKPEKQYSFLRFKLLEWYLQSFLAGTPRVICGFRDDNGIVRELGSYYVQDMPRMAGGKWSAAACLNFGLQFLDFVKRTVVKDYTENPYVKVIRSMEKIEVRCEIIQRRPLIGQEMLGIVNFEEIGESGPVTCCITSRRYHDMLQTFVVLQLRPRRVLTSTIFMQDVYPPHIYRSVKVLLLQLFTEEFIISRSFPNPWPPGLPDIGNTKG